MNLYLISQRINTRCETYDSAVVVAEDENSARFIHPGEYKTGEWWKDDEKFWRSLSWCDPKYVEVKLIGIAQESYKSGDVICASFNAH